MWNESLNPYGLIGDLPRAQVTQMEVTSIQGEGTLPANQLAGNVTQSLIIGDAANPNAAIYIDSQGIYAGNPVFSLAPFSVDLLGNLVAGSIVISGFIPTGGAAADVNAFAVTISGGKITANSITASQIAAATITGTQIAATTITATNLNVSTLSAITANLGTVTAGTINGVTIVGGLIETATSGQRVVINESGDNTVTFYDSSGNAMKLYGSSNSLYTNGDFFAQGEIISGSGGIISTATITGLANIISSTGLSVLAGGAVITGNTTVNGTFTATGTKSFDIDHPFLEGYRLRYAAVESPEVLVICRGEGNVSYPEHFIAVSEPGTTQVLRDGNYWIATAVRRGYRNYVNEYKGKHASDYPDIDEKPS